MDNLVALRKSSEHDNGFFDNKTLFGLIADDIEKQGYSVRPNALPMDVAAALYSYQQQLSSHNYKDAGIGRGDKFVKTRFVRTDEIYWITDEPELAAWLRWTAELKDFLNRRLFLGLFSFESHFAHYPPKAYYKRHYDAFRGEANRLLSVVTYLNPAWGNEDGGELVIYQDDNDTEGLKVMPLYGTIAVFLSEEFPHEVLPAKRDRYSIAGWYRLNTSIGNKIDPPY